MKIGIIAVGYQSEHLVNSLTPWLILKNGGYDGANFIHKNLDLDIKICTASALFKERYDMGERYENTKDEELLSKLKGKNLIEECFFVKEPIVDFESRNYCWSYLKQFDLDLIWQLDFGDEIYTVDQILNTIKYIQKNKYTDWYRVNFKNFTFDYNHYVDDFTPPRIHWVKKNGGVDRFVWDNDLYYKNGLHSNQCSNIVIPKSICFPSHYSWCGSKEYLKKKVEYQMRCLGTCSFSWNEKEEKLEFSKEYYKNKPQPELFSI